jgi:N-acetyl-anhydromuramyl-L-alanine amidase AmpD
MKQRDIRYIFVHCTATPQHCTAEQIAHSFKARGWRHPGYHYLVAPDGQLHTLLDEQEVANGVKGYNAVSIHIAYIGGIAPDGTAVDNRTEKQKATLAQCIARLRQRYPAAQVLGHRDISPDRNHNGRIDTWERIKECPCFDAIDEYSGVS